MALIQVKNLTFYYGGSYHYIFDNVSFQFDSHYKTALGEMEEEKQPF